MDDNHFQLFGLPVAYEVPMDALDRAYRELQGRVHPDRFANATEAERRVAIERATRANEAYQTLKSPLKRALYLLSLRGLDAGSESRTAMEPAFLAQQLDWREAVEGAKQAKNLKALEALQQDLRTEKRLRYGLLAALLEGGADGHGNEAAAEAARQLMFIEKVDEEIGDGIESLESA
jgi:molecular chaperone HscB